MDASFQFDRESYGWQAAAAWGGDYYTTAYNVRPRIRPAPLTRRLLVGKQICACPLRGTAVSPGSLAIRSSFSPPSSASSQLGNKFGAHFGPASNGTVEVVEFGNEPWNGYGPAWYMEVRASH